MKKVLIIKLSALGDVIFSIPLANVLKQNGYEVSWLVSEKGFQLVDGNPCVDNVIFAPLERWKKSHNPIKNFIEYIQLIKKLRAEKFDIAIDAQMIWKSFKFTRFCGAKRRIVAKNAREFAQFGATELIPSIRNGYDLHVTKTYLKFAEYLGLDTKDIKVTLPPIKDEINQKVDELLKGLDSSKKTVLVAPATTWKGKHWDKDNFRQVTRGLKDKVNLVFTGMPQDMELVEYISEGSGLNLVGKTNLEELRAVFERVDLVLSLDSGSTHVAWATQKPKIVSIFCATPMSFYAPIGSDEMFYAFQSENCKPCHRKKCPLKDDKIKCTKSPNAQIVLNKIIEMLGV